MVISLFDTSTYEAEANPPKGGMTMGREYAAAGVDYGKIDPFKAAMTEVGARTREFPAGRGVRVYGDGAFEYMGNGRPRWRQVTEGLGNKNWIAEWMYQATGDARHFAGIWTDTVMMAVVDLLRGGALPVVYTDEVAAGSSEWFADAVRREVLAAGLYEVCKNSGMALIGGESPALRYLVRSEPPVKDAPVFSGCATGIIAPWSRVMSGQIVSGAVIIGVPSSGLHANGISLVIKRTMVLPEQFLTRLPSGRTLGEEALIPTESYVKLMEALLAAEIEIMAVVPATGDGITKLLRYPRPFTYRIVAWPSVPPIFRFMRELGVELEECLRTFNWGIGLYLLVPRRSVELALAIGARSGYELLHLGRVEEGERKVIFEPEGGLELFPER